MRENLGEKRRVIVEIGAGDVGMPDRLPVRIGPIACRQRHLIDQTVGTTANRDRKPQKTVSGRDTIAAPPIPMGILHIIEKDEQVRVMDKVKEPFQRKIIGLIDDNAHWGMGEGDVR